MNTDIHFKRAEKFAKLMDNQFRFLGFRFGLDPILGFFPGAGDAVTLVLSSYILWIAHKAELSTDIKLKMARNIIIDFLIGSIPLLGDLADFFYKANTQNLALLKKELGTKTA